MESGVKLGGIFDSVKCFGPDGQLKWEEQAKNLVVNEGLDYLLGILLKGSTPSDPLYIGLIDGSPTIDAADSLTGTHSGWTEVTAYTEGTRQEFVDGALSSQSCDNSGSKASFSINSDSTTIGGAFLADDSTTGSNGTLLCAAAFTGGNKTADNGDTLEVQYTFSASDDGA
jgi:hypothetical protein